MGARAPSKLGRSHFSQVDQPVEHAGNAVAGKRGVGLNPHALFASPALAHLQALFAVEPVDAFMVIGMSITAAPLAAVLGSWFWFEF